MTFTHDQLVNVARKWLKRKCAIVVTELSSMGAECADALGFTAGGGTILIECKTSRADFLRDKQKAFRRLPERGMGQVRYFLTPAGLLKPEELPERWGLLEWNGRITSIGYYPQHFDERNHDQERCVLISCLRRLGIPERDGICVRTYTYDLYPSKRRATLGIQRDAEDHPVS